VLAVLLATIAASTSLNVTFWPDGRAAGTVHRATLRCDPTGGTLKGAAEACASLRKLGDNAFKPTRKDAVCAQVYGGPEEALVTGRYQGRTVWTWFRRRNGCETAPFAQHRFLFVGTLR
jgi:hypothetical protein